MENTEERTKRCKDCGEIKPFSDFYKHPSTKDGKGIYCKVCHNKRGQKYYVENKDAVTASNRRYVVEHKEQVSAQQRAYQISHPEGTAIIVQRYRVGHAEEISTKKKEKHRKDPRAVILQASKKRAKDYSVPFSITKDDIVIPEMCPVLGIKLEVGEGRLHNASPTLDRLIPSLGYVSGNIAVISWRANRLKNDGSPQELRCIADWVERQTQLPQAA